MRATASTSISNLTETPNLLIHLSILSQLLSNGKSPTRPKLALVPNPRLLTDFGGKFHAGQALPNRAGCRSLTGWGSLPHLSTCCFGSRDRSEIAGAPPHYLACGQSTETES